MVRSTGILIILGTATTLSLVQASPISRNQEVDNSFASAATAFPASEFSDWHNETRQRRMRMVVGRNESVFTLLPPPLNTDVSLSSRDKERRLKAIELFILEALGRSGKPAGTVSTPGNEGNTRLPVVQELPTASPRFQHRPNNTFPGQLDSFQASCDLPSKVDVDAWTQSGFFRIFFNLSSLENSNEIVTQDQPIQIKVNQLPSMGEQTRTTTTPGSRTGQVDLVHDLDLTTTLPTDLPIQRRKIQTANNINIVSAKLRLYKIGRGPNAEPLNFELPKTSEFCNNTNDEIAAREHQQHQQNRGGHQGQDQVHSTRSIVSENPAISEEKIFVKVYWYTAPMTKHHYKKKLLYSRTLLVKESGWIDFDIQKAARMWLESKINYGLTIEVENEDNDLVDVGTYFSNIDCPLNSTNQFSGQREGRREGQREPAGRSSRTPDPVTRYPSPILELCTLTLPMTSTNDHVRRAVSYQLSFSTKDVLRSDRALPKSSDSTGLALGDESHEDYWQSDDDPLRQQRLTTTTTTIPMPSFHRRRHHHGSNHRSAALSTRNSHWRDFGNGMQGDSPMVTEAPPLETTTTFRLDGDHPLKKIFATAKTYLSRDEMFSRRRKHSWNSRIASAAALDSSGEDALRSGTLRFSPIILEAENIVIENNRNSDYDDRQRR